ncbi:MAG: mechanosensitive ion channel [Chloroflexi bacterium]|nr:mechanosensitive ion channel [Chloroflexota bacterium]
MFANSDIQALLEQMITIWVFLQRTPVQRQLVAFGIAVAVAWGIVTGLHRLMGSWLADHMRSRWEAKGSDNWERAGTIVTHLDLPLVGLATLYVASAIMIRQHWPVGLLQESAFLLWILLAYRLVVALLHVTLDNKHAHLWHRRVLAPLFYLFLVGRGLGLLIDLGALAQVQIAQISDNVIRLGTIVTTVLVVYFLFTVSSIIQSMLQEMIIPRTAAEPGLVNAALTIGRYVVIIIAVSISLSMLGFNTSTLAFISGGITVAIGFGSQQVFANFISGVLLLFEQSLRPGDVVNMAGEMGVVESLSIRATTMRTQDNVAIVVPNQTFLTTALRNYSKNSQSTRVLVKVSVLYDGEPEVVQNLLLETARQNPAVLPSPPPAVYFTGFAKSKMDMQLAVWIRDPLLASQITSELYLMIREVLIAQQIDLA